MKKVLILVAVAVLVAGFSYAVFGQGRRGQHGHMTATRCQDAL